VALQGPIAVRVDRTGSTRYRNALERAYAQHLELRWRAGDLAGWRYEPIKLRLADGAFYTPDFLVVQNSGEMELHETKGFMREAARVRLKVAVELYPWFQFVIVRARGRHGFELEEVLP
jgi:hypothetical protein